MQRRKRVPFSNCACVGGITSAIQPAAPRFLAVPTLLARSTARLQIRLTVGCLARSCCTYVSASDGIGATANVSHECGSSHPTRLAFVSPEMMTRPPQHSDSCTHAASPPRTLLAGQFSVYVFSPLN